LQTIVDGVRMAETHDSSRSVTISLPQTKTSEDKVVELRYRFARRPPRGAMRLEPPQFSSAAWLRQVYWELVLPANEHLAVSPAGMTREWTWNWMGWCWQRQPVLSQADLEAWSGGAPSLESVGTNRYLLSATGELRTMEASTAGRTALVLGASLPSLLLGLALLYWPRVRRPVVAAVVAIVVLALALVDAESTLVLGQSAALGVALVAIALVLRRRSRWVASTGDRVRGSSISPTDRTVSGSKRGPRPGTLTSTAPASLAAQGSSGGFET
jgi:hypothetical protein